MKELTKHKRERKTLWQWLMEPAPTFPCWCQRKRKD